MQTKNTFVLPITFEIQICVNPSQEYPINVGILLNYQTLEKVSSILDKGEEIILAAWLAAWQGLCNC